MDTLDKSGVEAGRAAILQLQEALLAAPEAHVETPVRHHFAPGVYVRETLIPKGTVAVGKIHRTVNLFVMVSGDLEVAGPNGPTRLRGYNVLITTPGTKRAVYAREDTIVLNIHPTEETDLERIEDQVIAKDFAEIDGVDELVQIQGVA